MTYETVDNFLTLAINALLYGTGLWLIAAFTIFVATHDDFASSDSDRPADSEPAPHQPQTYPTSPAPHSAAPQTQTAERPAARSPAPAPRSPASQSGTKAIPQQRHLSLLTTTFR